MCSIRCWTLPALLIALCPAIAAGQDIITTIAGTEYLFPGDGKAADSAPLGNVSGIAADPDGLFTLADAENRIIARVGRDGILKIVAGNGIGDITGDNGNALAAGLRFPAHVTRDARGDLYFLDSDRIRRVNREGIITTVAGGGASTGDVVPAASLRLDSPGGLTVSGTGDLYVSDVESGRIYRISGGTARRIAGGGALQTEGVPAVNARINGPTGLALDAAGNLYIAEAGDGEGRVRRVGADGTIATVAGGGTSEVDDIPAVQARMNRPTGVALDGSGNLYIADESANLVWRVSGGVIHTIAGSGDSRSTGDFGPAIRAGLNSPNSVAVDADGVVYIGEFYGRRVRRVDTTGIITTAAGKGLFRFSGDGGPAISATLSRPARVVVDSSGAVFVADGENGRIRRISPAGIISTVAGGGLSAAENIPATQAELSFPAALALDGLGALYIGEYGRIRRVDRNGAITTIAGGGDSIAENAPALSAAFDIVSALAFDRAGNLYLAEGPANRVRVLGTNGLVRTVAGTGQAGSSGDGGPALQATLNEPRGLAVDATGNVYIADSAGGRVRRVNAAGVITTVAGGGTSLADGVAATSARLENPESLAFDAAGNLYIADSGSSEVRRVSTAGQLNTVAGDGGYEFGGDGGPARRASLNGPAGVALDSAGNLYIGDTENHRIRKVLVTSPSYVVAPALLNFSAQSDGVAPSELDLSISSVVPLGFTATPTGGPWLSVSPQSAAMPAVVRVAVNPAGLGPGVYQGTVTILAPNAAVPETRVPVTLTVTALGQAQPAVEPSGLQFTFAAGDSPGSQHLRVLNRGSGSIRFSAQTESVWLRLSGASGSATAAQPGSVTVTADLGSLAPGAYRSEIVVVTEAPGVRFAVPVFVTVSRASATILLSQTGLSFTAVQDGGVVPPQSVAILNIGRGTMNWTAAASVLDPGGNWLSVTPQSGSSTAGALDVRFVDVGINPAGLRPGEYYGRIRVEAAGADNSPQFLSVVLTVLSAGSNPGPLVRPTGFVFIGEEGASPSSQDLFISNLTASPLVYITGRTPEPPNALFAAAPAQGNADPTQRARLLLQPDFRRLPVGVRQGTLTLDFSDGSFQTVRVVLIVVPGGGSSASRGARAACAATSLHGELTASPRGFRTTVGYPEGIEARFADNCGQYLTSGTVVATFSNGDPPLKLAHIVDGRWSGTWTPGRGTAGPLALNIRARSQDSSISGEVTSSGTLSDSSVPVVLQGGVVSSASGVPYAPISPGSLITIHGRGLADGSQPLSAAPAPTRLLNTEVLLQGRLLPLLYVSENQINAVAPFTSNPNTQAQLVVQRGGRISVPVTVPLAPAQPSVFVDPQLGPNIVNEQGARVNEASPVRAGDSIVIYCEGLGPVDPPLVEGASSPDQPLSQVAQPVSVTVGGRAARVLFAGLTPGLIGIYHVNAEIPSGVTTGDSVPLVVTVAGQSSAPVSISVR